MRGVDHFHSPCSTIFSPSILGIMETARLQISRAVSNLLKRHQKHPSPDSRVDIRVKRRDDEVVLEIHDQGAGISPRDQAHIFNHFYCPAGGYAPQSPVHIHQFSDFSDVFSVYLFDFPAKSKWAFLLLQSRQMVPENKILLTTA